MSVSPVTFADIRQAATIIAPMVHRTPVLHSSRMNARSGATLHFKCENLQHTGSFKLRGASHALCQLKAAGLAGPVATHSSGNHGAALAEAARLLGLPAHIVVPDGAVATKLAAIEAYGGIIHRCDASQAAREAGLAELIDRLGAHPVPPYDDPRIIAGQGTAALELIDEVPELEVLLAPVGGGGLLAGTALVAREHGITAVGAEPAQADDCWRSLDAGARVSDHQPDTIADGLRAHVGTLNFQILEQQRVEIIRVSEAEIIAAMREFWHSCKLIIEPSSAVAIAAVLKQSERFAGKQVGIILSGGNVDLDQLPW